MTEEQADRLIRIVAEMAKLQMEMRDLLLRIAGPLAPPRPYVPSDTHAHDIHAQRLAQRSADVIEIPLRGPIG